MIGVFKMGDCFNANEMTLTDQNTVPIIVSQLLGAWGFDDGGSSIIRCDSTCDLNFNMVPGSMTSLIGQGVTPLAGLISVSDCTLGGTYAFTLDLTEESGQAIQLSLGLLPFVSANEEYYALFSVKNCVSNINLVARSSTFLLYSTISTDFCSGEVYKGKIAMFCEPVPEEGIKYLKDHAEEGFVWPPWGLEFYGTIYIYGRNHNLWINNIYVDYEENVISNEIKYL